MSERLLSCALAGIALPPALWPSLLDRYGSTYAHMMALNKYTAEQLPAVVAYMKHHDQEKALRDMARENSDDRVAHTILLAGATGLGVHDALLEYWTLDEGDMLRFALSVEPYSSAAADLLHLHESRHQPNPLIKDVLARRRSGLPVGDFSSVLSRYDSLSATSKRSKCYAGPFSPSRRALYVIRAINHQNIETDESFGPFYSKAGGPRPIAVLKRELGDATTEPSRVAWMMFLDLAESSNDYGLARMAHSAKLLAGLTELQPA